MDSKTRYSAVEGRRLLCLAESQMAQRLVNYGVKEYSSSLSVLMFDAFEEILKCPVTAASRIPNLSLLLELVKEPVLPAQLSLTVLGVTEIMKSELNPLVHCRRPGTLR